eukprot:scaffold1381_cov386-Prasinococcus_capsulatus_cf.AAC.2
MERLDRIGFNQLEHGGKNSRALVRPAATRPVAPRRGQRALRQRAYLLGGQPCQLLADAPRALVINAGYRCAPAARVRWPVEAVEVGALPNIRV